MRVGVHNSTSSKIIEKPGGITPTTVVGQSSITTDRPISPESAPKRRVHRPWLSTTSSGPPGTASSSAKARPRRVGHTRYREE